MNIQEIEDHYVVTDSLDKDSIIFDCGACVGDFTLPLYEKYGGIYHLYEPDFRNYRRLKNRFKSFKNMNIHNKAIDGKIGKDILHIGKFITASSLFDTHRGLGDMEKDVETTTIKHEMNEIGIKNLDLLKLDVEGSEIFVIPSMDKEILKKIKQIVVEYHLQSKIEEYSETAVNLSRSHLIENGFKEVIYIDKGNKGQEACYLNAVGTL